MQVIRVLQLHTNKLNGGVGSESAGEILYQVPGTARMLHLPSPTTVCLLGACTNTNRLHSFNITNFECTIVKLFAKRNIP